MYEVKEIPVNQIVIKDTAIRKPDPKSEKYQSIREDMRINGQIIPIMVYVDYDEETESEAYVMVEGSHRFMAAQEIGLTNLAAMIVPAGLSQAEIMGIQLRANALRVTQTASQEGEQYKRMLNSDPNMTVEEIAKHSGKSVSEVRGRLKLTAEKLGEKTVALVDAGKINLQNARTLGTLDPSLHTDDLLQAAQVMGAKEFQEHVHAIKTSLRTGEDPKGKKAPKEFEASAKFRDKELLISEIETGKLAKSKFVDPGQQEAFSEGIRFALSLDEDTISEAREKYELKQQEAEQIKVEKELAKAQKKAEELEKKAEEVRKLREQEETN